MTSHVTMATSIAIRKRPATRMRVAAFVTFVLARPDFPMMSSGVFPSRMRSSYVGPTLLPYLRTFRPSASAFVIGLPFARIATLRSLRA